MAWCRVRPDDRAHPRHDRDRARRRSLASAATTRAPRSAFRGPGVTDGRSAAANWTSRSTCPSTSRRWDPGTKRSPPRWPTAGRRPVLPRCPCHLRRRPHVRAGCERSSPPRAARTGLSGGDRRRPSRAPRARAPLERVLSRGHGHADDELLRERRAPHGIQDDGRRGPRPLVRRRPCRGTRCGIGWLRGLNGLFGAPARIRERLERYTREGIDEIVVELRKPDLDDQLEDLRIFWDAIQA